MKIQNIIAIAIAAVVAPACQAHVFSPPARVNTLESSATLEEAQQAVALAVGTTGTFGYEAFEVAGTYKKALSNELEVGVDGSFVAFDDSQAVADLDPYLMSARVRTKWAPAQLGGYAALTAGLGGGYSFDGGGFVSPDLGAVVAFENQYVVPYAGFSGFVSQPIASKAVDISRDEEAIGTRISEPQFTWGFYANAGLKVPIALRNPEQTLNIYAGGHLLYFQDSETNETASGLMIGPEFVF